MTTPLSQDPNRTRQFQEKQPEAAIERLRLLRKTKGWTIAQFTAEMSVSEGMVSKIENGQVSPSLSMLQLLSETPSVPLTALFQGFEEDRPAMHVKAGEWASSCGA